MSIVSLHQVTLILAGNRILDAANWQIQPKDRIALVGRNGAGKSTLMRLLQGEIAQDSGQIKYKNGLRMAGLTQEVPIDHNETVYHFLVKGLGEIGEALDAFHQLSAREDLDKMAQCQQRLDALHAWDFIPKVDAMASHLGIDPNTLMNTLSGGMKRRVLLAQALLVTPDLLLLDEPTNHLDVESIEWLESYLKTYSGSVLVVTHDRAFLNAIANKIVEIDRGQLHSFDCDYETYLDRKEAMRLNEDKQNALFDKRLAQEETWIRTGIKARRTRNEGRVRALKAMRQAHQKRRSELGNIKAMTLDVARSGNTVLEATQLSYKREGQVLLSNFSFLLTRGDKVGIIGPNGCGKTTLIRLLLGELKPDGGTLHIGTSLSIAYFDQLRRQLNEQQTVMQNVGDGADYVTVNGQEKHVASYLREFLFSPERFNQPVSSLSGGEKNRLLLAKLFARPVNFLVLDEPTNDLDIQTLELLENMLIDYPGTLLLISHDRAFINQVVTSILVYEGQGHFQEYFGGYDDYKQLKDKAALTHQTAKQKLPAIQPTTTPSNKMSASEHRELTKLPEQIEALEEKIRTIQLDMSQPSFYQQDNATMQNVQQQLAAHESKLSALYERWEQLESRK